VLPDPNVLHPMAGQERLVQLKPLISSPLIEVGEFSYYDDPDHPTEFETRNVLYNFGPERLIIGRFCAFAAEVRFIMNAANHRMDGPSTFPFPIMGGSWAEHMDLLVGLPSRGDTVVGSDVWLGHSVLVMPGVAHRARRRRRDRRGRRRRRAGLRHRGRQPGEGDPAEVLGCRRRPAAGPRLVGLAARAHHRARSVIMSGTVDDLERVTP